MPHYLVGYTDPAGRARRHTQVSSQTPVEVVAEWRTAGCTGIVVWDEADLRRADTVADLPHDPKLDWWRPLGELE